MKAKDILMGYGMATLGQFLVAVGVALAVKSDLGQGPLPGPAYAFSTAGIGSLSLGVWLFIVNCFLILIQLAVLRKEFKVSHLMQIAASAVFGALTDLACWIFAWISLEFFWERILLTVLACLVTALGTSIEVVSRGWMLSVEMTISAISRVTRSPFSRVKVFVDCAHVLVTMVLCWIFFHNPLGQGDLGNFWDFLLVRVDGSCVAVGLGTVIMAFGVGPMMRLTDPVADRLMDAVISRVMHVRQR